MISSQGRNERLNCGMSATGNASAKNASAKDQDGHGMRTAHATQVLPKNNGSG